MRLLLLALALLFPTAASTSETFIIEPTTPGWWIEPQPISFGGSIPLATATRIGCAGFVSGPSPTLVVEHNPQHRMPLGFLEFRITTQEPGVEATVAVQMPNGAFLCGIAGGSILRAGAFPGTYRIWAASRSPSHLPAEGFLEISHVPLSQRR